MKHVATRPDEGRKIHFTLSTSFVSGRMSKGCVIKESTGIGTTGTGVHIHG